MAGMNRWHMMNIMVVIVGLLVVAPAASAAPAGDDAKTVCQGEGYLYVTTADGASFKNAGQCMKYIKQGGEVIQLPRLTITFTKPVDGHYSRYISGVELMPGAILYVGTDVSSPIDIGQINPDGTYASPGGVYPCGTFTWMEVFTLDEDGVRIAARASTPC